MGRLLTIPSPDVALRRLAQYGLSTLIALGLVMSTYTQRAEAKKGLGAAAVGFAAGVIIGGAMSQAAKNKQAKPQPKARPKKKYTKPRRTPQKTQKARTRTAPKKRTYTKKRSTSPRRSVAAVPQGDPLVLQQQKDLALLGHMSGDVNGKKDEDFRNAVRSYQRSHRVAATGVLGPEQAGLLEQQAQATRELVEIGSPDADFSGRAGDKRIQQALQALGHYDGAIDGILGSGSRRAVTAYQSANGLPATGELVTREQKIELITFARKKQENRLVAVTKQFAAINKRQLATLAPAAAQPTASESGKTAAAVATKDATAKTQTAAVTTMPNGNSLLPQTNVKPAALASAASGFKPIEPVRLDAPIRRPNDVAVIIGNRDYQGDIPDVAFGHRDADAMKALMINELGFSPANVIDARDAGQAELVAIFGSETNNRGKVWRLIDPDGASNVFVFYSGHGAPDTKSRSPYLMPVDSHPDTIELNGYQLSQMYANLESLEVSSVAVFLDACFSGGSAGGMLTQAASPVAVTAKMPVAKSDSKLTVLAAAEGDQLASWNEKDGFGMFTNYLVSGLKGEADQDGDKSITASELHTFVHDRVRRSARRQFGRIQTPVLMGKADYVVRAK